MDPEALLAALASPDRKEALRAEKAFARGAGKEALALARARLTDATGAERARLVRLLGRVARTSDDAAEELRPLLVERLDDTDGATRRQAIVALGRLGGPGVMDELLARAPAATAPEQRRAFADAFGRLGDPRALPALEQIAGGDDPELARLVAEARTKLARGPARDAREDVDGSAVASEPLVVWLHARRGLEPLLLDELAGCGATVDAPGRLRASVTSLAVPLAARTMLRLGFPLPLARVDDAAVARVLASEDAWRIFTTFSRPPIRYRLDWAGSGKRRASTLHIAGVVAKARAELVNDPRQSAWEAIVHVEERVLELWPRGLADERFSYRRALVPASSHPTVAAALARVAGVAESEVVWDPFVGAATELVEWSRLAGGGAHRFFGSDLDQGALAAARENLAAAGVVAELVLADACTYQPPARPTLVITNPPMGRRVASKEELRPLYAELMRHVAGLLAPGGRMVWVSPLPRDSEGLAAAAGLSLRRRLRLDMGGFWAELQRFEPRARA